MYVSVLLFSTSLLHPVHFKAHPARWYRIRSVGIVPVRFQGPGWWLLFEYFDFMKRKLKE
jgi:hypothetical protein